MPERPPVDALLAQSLQRLAGLTEWPLRTCAFAAFAAEISSEDASSLFDALLARAVVARDRATRVASFTARFAAARGDWPAERIARAREAAVAQGDRLTDAFLFAPEAEEFDDASFAAPDYGGERPLSLGERRALAARPTRRTIELVTRDPDPRVASRLLGNPKLTEADLVRVAARRPFPAASLVEIGLHPKWRERPRIGIALVQNPCTPAWLSLSLLPDLPARAVAETADDGNLDPSLRAAAGLLLEVAEEMRQPFP
jgi:hypothetical protein